MKLEKKSKYISFNNLQQGKSKVIKKILFKGKVLIVLGGLLLTTSLTSKQYVYSAPSDTTTDLSIDEENKLNQIMDNLNKIRQETNRKIDQIHSNSSNYVPDSEGGTPIILTDEEKSKLELIMSNLSEQRSQYIIDYYDVFNKYCGFYGVDVDEAYALANTLTNNFSSESFQTTFNIGNTTFYQKTRTYPNIQSGIIAYIRCLALNPEEYGVSKELIKNKEAKNYNGSYEAFTKEVCDIIGVDSNRMLAIIYQETGELSSSAFNNKNNPAGLMTSNGVKKFYTKEQGIIESVFNVYFRFYQNKNCSIEDIGEVYCPIGAENDPTGMNASWVSGVRNYENNILSNPEVFDNEHSNGILR